MDHPILFALALLALALVLAAGVHLAALSRRRGNEGRASRLALEREIRERGLVEDALRQSEQRLARVVETIAEGVFIVDREGRISFANAMAERLVGLSRDEITRRQFDAPEWEVTTCEGTPMKSEELPVALVLQSGKPVFGVELCMNGPDDKQIIASVNAAPIPDASGALAGVVCTVSDVTHRKAVERMKDTLVSTVSHELRTPLASLRGFTELMLERDYSPQKRREFLIIIRDESIRLGQLIDDLLDIRRMESGRQTYAFEAVDLGRLCEATRRLFGGELSLARVHLDLPAELPAIHADADRIQQVLSNLVSNALKFSPEDAPVRLAVRVGEGQVLVEVADRGMGISDEDLPRLFTRFFRTEEAEAAGVRGTGLGLALVKEIVEAHGGLVWAESTRGEGSRFRFSLRVAEASEARDVPAAPTSENAAYALDPRA